MSNKLMFRAAAILWAMWGLLHFVGGLGMVTTFMGEVAGIPESVTLTSMGSEMPFHVRRVLAEHQFNNTWFGLVVTIGSVLVWRGSRLGVFLCAIVGGLAQLGFTIFVVIPGLANGVGVAMTFIAAAGTVLGLAANFRSSSNTRASRQAEGAG